MAIGEEADYVVDGGNWFFEPTGEGFYTVPCGSRAEAISVAELEKQSVRRKRSIAPLSAAALTETPPDGWGVYKPWRTKDIYILSGPDGLTGEVYDSANEAVEAAWELDRLFRWK